MIEITADQVAAAVGGDAEAAEGLVRALDGRISHLARRIDAATAEDLAQEGRLSLWLALRKFEGTTPAQFVAFADTTLRVAMTKRRKVDQRQGVSRATAERFERCLRATGGDPWEAERLATTDRLLGTGRLSAELAELARLSWQGADSLESGLPGQSHGDTLTYADERQRISDEERAATRAKIAAVRATLDGLPQVSEAVLSAEFGIGDHPMALGQSWGQLAEAVGVSRAAIVSVEAEARRQFEAAYLGGEPARPAADSAEGKVCKCCGVSKPVTGFYERIKGSGKRMATCKTCKRSAKARYQAAHRATQNQHNAAYRLRRKASPEAAPEGIAGGCGVRAVPAKPNKGADAPDRGEAS